MPPRSNFFHGVIVTYSLRALTLDCILGIPLVAVPDPALPPPPMLILPLPPTLLLPLVPKLVRPALLELMDCLLSPSEEPGREGIIASVLLIDTHQNMVG